MAARDNLAVKNGLKLDFVERVFDVPFLRSPFSLQNMGAYRELKKIVDAGGYDVIHCNTPVGGIVGRLAARQARAAGAQVFYTAHGFHFFQGAPGINWAVYYPIEKWMCRYTDKLITVNEEDFELAKRKFRTEICRIHGVGADQQRYQPPSPEQREQLRGDLGFGPEEKLILCTGELNANKNQITAIRAMAQVVRKVPAAKLLLAGNGGTERALRDAAESLGLSGCVQFLGYRTDLERYVKASDLILSCSKREGLPLNIVEGMLCGKAVVASENRGHRELVEEEVTGYLVDPLDADGFAERICRLLAAPEPARRLGQEAIARASRYTDEAVQDELEKLYDWSTSVP